MIYLQGIKFYEEQQKENESKGLKFLYARVCAFFLSGLWIQSSILEYKQVIILSKYILIYSILMPLQDYVYDMEYIIQHLENRALLKGLHHVLILFGKLEFK